MPGQRVDLPSYSMFMATPVYEVGENIVFGLMQEAVVPDASDTLYTLPSPGAERLDIVSDFFYGTPHLWWVLASVNRIHDPIAGPPTGTVLRIPTRDRLSRLGVLTL